MTPPESEARYVAGWNAAIEAAVKVVENTDVVEHMFAGHTYDNGAKTLGNVERAILALRKEAP